MERVNRSTDRQVYQPRIHADLIHELYLLKTLTGMPMTVLVDVAVLMLLDKYRNHEGEIKAPNS